MISGLVAKVGLRTPRRPGYLTAHVRDVVLGLAIPASSLCERNAKPRILATVTYCSPASLSALTRRNSPLKPGTTTKAFDPVARRSWLA